MPTTKISQSPLWRYGGAGVEHRRWVGCVLQVLIEAEESVTAGINFSVHLFFFGTFLSAASLSRA
jgi:hypothetical protein